MIELASEQLDMLLFEELLAKARAAGRTDEAFDRLHRALALWRGTPLAELPGSPLWDGRLRLLAEARLGAAEELITLRLARGDHAGAIGELRGLLREHPFREDLWRQLDDVALHRSGRQAEALHTYAGIRRRLVTELGIEPGAELRRAHSAILAGEVPVAEIVAGHPPAPATAPRQLPDVPDFTGRAESIATLTRALSAAERPPAGPPSIAVVTGTPGVGKSALAVHCAHAVRAGYPAGQLYLDLRGTEPVPADPGELLAEALRALGVGPADLPGTERERSALYRSLLAERPMLVLLDDAAGIAQVRPLLPGNGCAVLVTSRRRITELPGHSSLSWTSCRRGRRRTFWPRSSVPGGWNGRGRPPRRFSPPAATCRWPSGSPERGWRGAPAGRWECCDSGWRTSRTGSASCAPEIWACGPASTAATGYCPRTRHMPSGCSALLGPPCPAG